MTAETPAFNLTRQDWEKLAAPRQRLVEAMDAYRQLLADMAIDVSLRPRPGRTTDDAETLLLFQELHQDLGNARAVIVGALLWPEEEHVGGSPGDYRNWRWREPGIVGPRRGFLEPSRWTPNAPATMVVEPESAAPPTPVDTQQLRIDLEDELRADEGDSVLLCHDNPDFGGPANIVICNGIWTAGFDRRYTGDSLLQTLQKAVDDKRRVALSHPGGGAFIDHIPPGTKFPPDTKDPMDDLELVGGPIPGVSVPARWSLPGDGTTSEA